MQEPELKSTILDIVTVNAAPQTQAPGNSNQQQTIDVPERQDENPAKRGHEKQGRKCEAPVRVFLLLCLLYAAVFVDRGSLATTAINGHEEADGVEGRGMRGDFAMSNFENGSLSSILMIGGVLGSLAAPYFSRIPPLIVIGIGMVMWTFAALGCAFSIDFYTFAGCRFMMGIGQAPVFTLGSIVVDDIAPELGSTTWSAIFQVAPCLGAAAGFFYGPLVGNTLTWRHAFYFEAALVAPLVFLCFLQKRFYLENRSVQQEGGADSSTDQSCGRNGKRLFSHILFDLAILGDSLYIGYLSCLEYWTTRAIEAVFSPDGVDMTMGAMLFACSVAGTLLGGALMDYVFGASVQLSFSLPAVSLLTSAVIVTPTVLFMQSYPGMLTLLGLTLVILCIPQGPINVASLWTLPPDLRALGRGQLVLFNQLLGTIPAPALYGLVVDWMEKSASKGQSHRVAQALSAGLLVFSSVILFYARFISAKHPDYKTENEQ